LNKKTLTFALLLGVVLFSSVGLVYVKHLNRKLFVELQLVQQERDRFVTEFGQLQLEQSAWSAYGRIEQIARQQLHMAVPGLNAVEMIRQ
jgi:cell division protein FtsL